ncbi:hypothetical protein GCM10009624_15580 [Gordonia sinesedis]
MSAYVPPNRRTVLVAAGLAAAGALAAACGRSSDTSLTDDQRSPTVRVVFDPPLDGDAAPNPTAKVSVRAEDGVLNLT